MERQEGIKNIRKGIQVDRQMKIDFKTTTGTSLVVQWLRLRTPNAGYAGMIPGRGINILHTVQCGQKK